MKDNNIENIKLLMRTNEPHNIELAVSLCKSIDLIPLEVAQLIIHNVKDKQKRYLRLGSYSICVVNNIRLNKAITRLYSDNRNGYITEGKFFGILLRLINLYYKELE